MMKEGVKQALLKYFPISGDIPYEEFEGQGMSLLPIYSYDPKIIKYLYEILSQPWAEICWLKVIEIDVDLWITPGLLNQKNFIRSFPSLVSFIALTTTKYKYETDTGCETFVENFIEQLNFNIIKDDWKKEFYFSLDGDVKRIVCRVLKDSIPCYLGAEEALDSYWRQWSE